jgi:predicted RNA-binding protein with PIN domain
MRELIVDGYNVIHAWPALKRALTGQGLQESRLRLIEALAAYASQAGVEVTVVFDAGGRQRSAPTVETVEGITVRFGTRTASADHVIERLAYQASRRGDGPDLAVATDDRLQRDVVGAMGIPTMSCKALADEVSRAASGVEDHARRLRDAGQASQRIQHRLDPKVTARLERLRQGLSDDGDSDASGMSQ